MVVNGGVPRSSASGVQAEARGRLGRMVTRKGSAFGFVCSRGCISLAVVRDEPLGGRIKGVGEVWAFRGPSPGVFLTSAPAGMRAGSLEGECSLHGSHFCRE
jgi:hypothetical protein